MKFLTIEQATREAQVQISSYDDELWFVENIDAARCFIQNKIEATLFESQEELNVALTSTNPPKRACLIDPCINKAAALLISEWYDVGSMSIPDSFFDVISHLKPEYSA